MGIRFFTSLKTSSSIHERDPFPAKESLINKEPQLIITPRIF